MFHRLRIHGSCHHQHPSPKVGNHHCKWSSRKHHTGRLLCNSHHQYILEWENMTLKQWGLPHINHSPQCTLSTACKSITFINNKSVTIFFPTVPPILIPLLLSVHLPFLNCHLSQLLSHVVSIGTRRPTLIWLSPSTLATDSRNTI